MLYFKQKHFCAEGKRNLTMCNYSTWPTDLPNTRISLLTEQPLSCKQLLACMTLLCAISTRWQKGWRSIFFQGVRLQTQKNNDWKDFEWKDLHAKCLWIRTCKASQIRQQTIFCSHTLLHFLCNAHQAKLMYLGRFRKVCSAQSPSFFPKSRFTMSH